MILIAVLVPIFFSVDFTDEYHYLRLLVLVVVQYDDHYSTTVLRRRAVATVVLLLRGTVLLRVLL